jgi:hypothetical protein
MLAVLVCVWRYTGTVEYGDTLAQSSDIRTTDRPCTGSKRLTHHRHVAYMLMTYKVTDARKVSVRCLEQIKRVSNMG